MYCIMYAAVKFILEFNKKIINLHIPLPCKSPSTGITQNATWLLTLWSNVLYAIQTSLNKVFPATGDSNTTDFSVRVQGCPDLEWFLSGIYLRCSPPPHGYWCPFLIHSQKPLLIAGVKPRPPLKRGGALGTGPILLTSLHYKTKRVTKSVYEEVELKISICFHWWIIKLRKAFFLAAVCECWQGEDLLMFWAKSKCAVVSRQNTGSFNTACKVVGM